MKTKKFMYSVLFLVLCVMVCFRRSEAFAVIGNAMSGIEDAVGIDVNMEDLKFRYYNRNHNGEFLINITDDNFANELRKIWNYAEDLKVITHGWISSDTSITVAGVKDAYIATRGLNVITLDWSYTASTKNYPVPAVMTQQVGIYAAQVLDKLVELDFIQYDRIHIIGHSLGSHVSGSTGSHCKGKIARITGLDPAGPGFQVLLGNDMRLDETDAQFVDVIHTAAGTAGFYNPLGHADFYPNSGKPPQPGCVELSYNLVSTVAKPVGCSHTRAYLLFIESIKNPTAFKSVRCDSWSIFESGSCPNDTDVQYMGDGCSSTARGVYYLATNAEAPYSTLDKIRNTIADVEDMVTPET